MHSGVADGLRGKIGEREKKRGNAREGEGKPLNALWITTQVRIHTRSGHFLYACLDSHMGRITLSIH